MKNQKTFNYCEYCDAPIDDHSPPSKKRYKQGGILLGEYSTMLLPPSVVEKNHKEGVSDSHVASLRGHYCNWKCLRNLIKQKLEL